MKILKMKLLLGVSIGEVKKKKKEKSLDFCIWLQ